MAIDASLVGARGTSSSNTVSTTGGSVTTGDTLVAVVSYDPGTTISSISDTAGNTYSLASNNTGGFARLALYYCSNATGHASNVLTVNFSGTAFPVAHLVKITDAATSSYDGASLVSSTDSDTPFTITSGTFAQADTCVISCFEGNRNGTTSAYATSTDTLLSAENDAVNFWTSAVGYRVVASTSAVTPSWTKGSETSPGVTRGLIVVGFKQTAGGGPRKIILVRP